MGGVLGQLVEKEGTVYLLIDALDEMNVDRGFLYIFPDLFPEGVRVLITGRNCVQVEKFWIGGTGLKKLKRKKLERVEVPAITEVEDQTRRARRSTTRSMEDNGRWTYAIKEIR